MRLRLLATSALLACFFMGFERHASAMMRSTFEASDRPAAVYGAPGTAILLRVADDSAGSSGMLGALSRDFLAQHHVHGAVAWYQDSDSYALKQLRAGHVDIALLTEDALVDQAVKTQLVTHATQIFRAREILVGPSRNPAHIASGDSIETAFRKIQRFGNIRVAAGGAPLFLSRDDASAANEKERAIWQRAGVAPWISHNLWYRSDPVFAKQALLDADHESLYTLTDSATWAGSVPRIAHLRRYVSLGKSLQSTGIAVLRPYPATRVRLFLRYLQSERALSIIARYNALP